MPRGGKKTAYGKALAGLRREVQGHAIRVSPVPPTIAIASWVPYIVPIVFPATSVGKVYNLSQISDILRDVHGLRADGTSAHRIPGFVRLISIKAWTTSGAATASVSIEVFDPASRSAASAVLFRETKVAAKNQWASLGYHYPMTVSLVPFTTSDAFNVVEVVGSSTITIHFSLLFRPSAVEEAPERAFRLAAAVGGGSSSWDEISLENLHQG